MYVYSEASPSLFHESATGSVSRGLKPRLNPDSWQYLMILSSHCGPISVASPGSITPQEDLLVENHGREKAGKFHSTEGEFGLYPPLGYASFVPLVQFAVNIKPGLGLWSDPLFPLHFIFIIIPHPTSLPFQHCCVMVISIG